MTHNEFCLKYPEVVINGHASKELVQSMIDNNIMPVIEISAVFKMIDFYKMDNTVFNKYKDVRKEWEEVAESSRKAAKNTNFENAIEDAKNTTKKMDISELNSDVIALALKYSEGTDIKNLTVNRFNTLCNLVTEILKNPNRYIL